MDGKARAEKTEVDTSAKENNSEASTEEQSFNRLLRDLEAFFPEEGSLSTTNTGYAALSGSSCRRADTKDYVAK